MKELEVWTDIELLAELLRRHRLRVGPFRVVWSYAPRNAIIGIGRDHHADIYIGEEDLLKLHELVNEGAAVRRAEGDDV